MPLARMDVFKGSTPLGYFVIDSPGIDQASILGYLTESDKGRSPTSLVLVAIHMHPAYRLNFISCSVLIRSHYYQRISRSEATIIQQKRDTGFGSLSFKAVIPWISLQLIDPKERLGQAAESTAPKSAVA